jgi:hypothetical protein
VQNVESFIIATKDDRVSHHIQRVDGERLPGHQAVGLNLPQINYAIQNGDKVKKMFSHGCGAVSDLSEIGFGNNFLCNSGSGSYPNMK